MYGMHIVANPGVNNHALHTSRRSVRVRPVDRAAGRGVAGSTNRSSQGTWGVDCPENESYSNYADIIGTLECAKQELYRRWVADYEDKAIAKNGDL
jgi:hypothetical protein